MRILCVVYTVLAASALGAASQAGSLAEFVGRLRRPAADFDNSLGSVVSTDGRWVLMGGFSGGPLSEQDGPLIFDLQNLDLAPRSLSDPPSGYSPVSFTTDASIDDSVIVVKARREFDSASGIGLVYDAATGDLIRTLDPGAPLRTNGFSGYAIDRGQILAVGYEDPLVFDAATGGVIATLTANDGTVFDSASTRAFTIGDGLAAILHVSDATQSNYETADSLYIFDATSGEQVARIEPPNAAEGIDFLDDTIAVDEGRVLVGSLDTNTGVGAGVAYLFDAVTGGLIHTLSPSIRDPDTGELIEPTDVSLVFARSVALEGDHALIGSNFELLDRDELYAAYLFDAASGEQIERLASPGGRPSPFLFGVGAAIADDWAIVGSARNGAYAYRLVPEPTAATLLAIAVVAAISRGSRRGSRRRSG